MADDFRAAVFAQVARIPAGRVASYGQVACMADRPRAARVVGQILARADGLGLPCHRVVRADGSLCEGAFGMPGVQQAMLRAEGVPFTADGRVDMRAAQWMPQRLTATPP